VPISILVVEDDIHIQELVAEFLRTQDYRVDVAETGVEGYEKFTQGDYQLVILDVMLPGMDGYALCKLIRNSSDVPIIFLTALGEERDQIRAFELQADDFITNPFSFTILTKRVEAVLRRANKLDKGHILAVGIFAWIVMRTPFGWKMSKLK
jgi:two-component system, OmpR family, response regulator VanR